MCTQCALFCAVYVKIVNIGKIKEKKMSSHTDYNQFFLSELSDPTGPV